MATKKPTTTTKKSSSSSVKKKPVTKQVQNKTKTKSNPSNKKEKNVLPPETVRQRTAIILLSIAVLFLAATLIKGEHLWLGLHNFIFGIFGVTAFAWPLMLIYLAIIIASNKSMMSARSNIIGASLFVLILSGIVHLFSPSSEIGELSAQFSEVWAMRDFVTIASGGITGVIFGGIPRMLFGKVAAAIVLIVLLIVVFMFVTGTTLLGLACY